MSDRDPMEMLVARVELSELFNRFADALDTKEWDKHRRLLRRRRGG